LRFSGPLAFLVALLAGFGPVLAAQCTATTNANANLRPSMGSASPIGIIPKGSGVSIDLCFNRGDFCAVTWGDKAGFVSGDLISLTSSGQVITAREAEETRWNWLSQADAGGSRMIVAWGDSLTYGAGVDQAQGPSDQAVQLFGCVRDIENEGIGGQTSTSIAARMNAIPTLLGVEGDAIPAAGLVTVVERTALPVTNQGPSAIAGSLCGVSGELQVSEKVDARAPVPPYQFVRATPGSAATCPPGSRFTTVAGEAMRNRVAWLWLGRNGADTGRTVAGDIEAAVASLGHQRYLVGSVLAARLDDGTPALRIFELNAALKRSYGSRFVDVLGALVAAASESAEDQADARQGFVPRSLLSDNIHLNQKGYAIVARVFHDATIANGF
jgi:hypothetical protein